MMNEDNAGEIQRLKEENEKLKSALESRAKPADASKKVSTQPRFF